MKATIQLMMMVGDNPKTATGTVKAIPGLPSGYFAIVHRGGPNKLQGWTVTEGTSGHALAYGDTANEAVNNAKHKVVNALDLDRKLAMAEKRMLRYRKKLWKFYEDLVKEIELREEELEYEEQIDRS